MNEDIFRFLGNEMSPIESKEFLEKLESDVQLKQDFIKYQNTYTLMHLLPQGNDVSIGKSGFIRFSGITKQKKLRRLFIKVTTYAATVAVLMIATWFISSQHTNQLMASATNEVFVPPGQRARLTLDDGTVVWLNAQSTLTYPAVFTGNERHVTLSGEGFFEVTHNPDKPFTVSAQDLFITVLGTEFNVSAYEKETGTEISLIDGSVKVWNELGSEKVLTPNQQLTYINGEMLIASIDHREYFLWKDGIYSFNNEPFVDIMRKLERYYNVKIEVRDLPVSDWEYTGKFRQQDGIETIIRILQIAYPFKMEKKDDVIILRKK